METQNKNNFANIIGWILILGIIFSLAYYIFLKDNFLQVGMTPEDSRQSMENAPLIEDPLEREAVRTQDRPDFSAGIENLE